MPNENYRKSVISSCSELFVKNIKESKREATVMFVFRKHKRLLSLVMGACLLGFISGAYAAPFGRLMPKGKVIAYDGNKKVAEFNSEVALPQGALLETEGICGVKTNDFYLVAADKAKFSISGNQISVKAGTVYFALSELPKGLMFINPHAALTVQQVMVNAAATSGIVQGFISDTEFGVIEGGSLIVSSMDSEKLIPAGRKIEVSAQTVGQGWLDSQEGQGFKVIAGSVLIGGTTYLVVKGDSAPSPSN